MSFVCGLGVWTPGLDGLEAWRAGQTSECGSPPARLIAPRQRRRATLLTMMAAEVLQQATAAGSRDPGEVALITASSGGELATTFANLELLVGDPPSSSPLRFGNSVHNAALGHLSTSTRNQLFASAISAHRERIVSAAMLETLAWVRSTGIDAALLFTEETWPGAEHAPMAAAILLSARSEGALGELGRPSRHTATARGTLPLPAATAASPCAGAFSLVSALATAAAGRIALDHGWSIPWSPA